jgi:hypothetical protein
LSCIPACHSPSFTSVTRVPMFTSRYALLSLDETLFQASTLYVAVSLAVYMGKVVPRSLWCVQPAGSPPGVQLALPKAPTTGNTGQQWSTFCDFQDI